jgi:hypothetical protein
MSSVWTKIDRGLYTGPLGSIIREHDGWYFFNLSRSVNSGPHETLWHAKHAAAKHAAEENAKAEKRAS